MAALKYVAGIGIVVIAVVAFVAGLYASPFVFPPPAEEPEDPVWDRVTTAGKIVVGTEPGWPPYEFLAENGSIIGFEIELMEMIADELNLTVEWRNMAFDAIIPSVQAMDIDLGVSGFSVTAKRLEVIQYTMPHSITEGQIIMLQSRANELGITELESISNLTDLGLICGTQRGTTQEAELKEVASGALRSYADFLLALEDMKGGAIDCVYAETPITSNWILEAEQKGEEPIVVIYRRPYYPVAFVANQDADILVAKINGVLSELIASAKLDQLKQKWKCD
jgi:ABC-type amino acid transport substrate-binding protein